MTLMTDEQATGLQGMLAPSPDLGADPTEALRSIAATDAPMLAVAQPGAMPPSAPPPQPMPPAAAAAPPGPAPDSGLPHHNDVSAQVAPNIKPVTVGGVQLSPFLSWTFHAESGGDPNAKPIDPRTGKLLSSASGYFQITDPTYEGIMRNHPELHGLTKNDPRVAMALENDNKVALTKGLGHEPNLMEQRAAWFFGSGGAISFLHTLDTNPNTTVDHVLSPQAITANRAVMVGPDGKPRTVAEVYRLATQSLGGGGGGGGGGAASPGAAPGAAPAQAGQPPTGSAQLAGQQDAIAKYMQSQPGMWDKLAALRSDYLQQREPSMASDMQDALYQHSMMQSAADAKRNTSAGSIIFNQVPSAQEFQQGLRAEHDVTTAQRQRALDTAKTTYDTGTAEVGAQNEQAMKNLGLTGDMARALSELAVKNRELGQGDSRIGIEQQNADTQRQTSNQSFQIAMLKYGQEQTAAFQKSLDDITKDPNVKAEIMRRFLAGGGDPNAPLQTNLRKLNQTATEYLNGPSSTGTAAAPPSTGPLPGGVTPISAPAGSAPGTPNTGPAGTAAPPAGQAPASGAQPPQEAAGDPRYPGIPGVSPAGVPPPPRSLDGQESSGWELRILNPKTQRYEFYDVPKGPAGIAWTQAVRGVYGSTAQLTNLTVPQTSQNVTVNGGGGGEGGKGAPAGNMDQWRMARETQSAADAALKLLPLIDKAGGNGPLTNSQLTKDIAAAIYQASNGTIDPLKVPVRELFNKLVSQVQSGLVLPQMAQIGRATQGEMLILREGTVPGGAQIAALRQFLTHTSDMSDHTQKMLDNRMKNEEATSLDRGIPYNQQRVDRAFEQNNRAPVWLDRDAFDQFNRDLAAKGGSSAGSTSSGTQSGPQAGPNGEPIRTNAQGLRAYQGPKTPQNPTGWVIVP